MNVSFSTFDRKKFTSVLSKYNYKAKEGDVLAGIIIGIERKHALVDIGLDQIAFLPMDEICINRLLFPNEIVANNDIGEFVILHIDQTNKKVIVSMVQLHYIRLWERLKQINFENTILYGKIENSIWGGKIVNFEDLKIFTPNSHLPKYYRRKQQQTKFLPLKIIQLKDKIFTIIASSRLALLKKQSHLIKVGMIRTGCIVSIKPFGIFLNVQGIKCLLHISEISTQKIIELTSLYKKGDELKIKIIYIDINLGRIALSMKKQ
jgi:small subunit ribosomal protein S1